MARYIDADAINARLDYCVKEGMGSTIAFTFKHIIDETPTADVRENVRGFWYALEKGDRGYSAGDFKCSICGEPNHTWLPKPNFCPNCGADMRGENR